MSTGHDNDVRRTSLGHHFGFEVAAIHRLEIGHDGCVRKGFSQGSHTMKTLGQNERCACLEPIHSGTHGECGRFESFVDIGEVEGNLDNGFHGGGWELAELSRSLHHRHDKDDAKCDTPHLRRAVISSSILSISACICVGL